MIILSEQKVTKRAILLLRRSRHISETADRGSNQLLLYDRNPEAAHTERAIRSDPLQ